MKGRSSDYISFSIKFSKLCNNEYIKSATTKFVHLKYWNLDWNTHAVQVAKSGEGDTISIVLLIWFSSKRLNLQCLENITCWLSYFQFTQLLNIFSMSVLICSHASTRPSLQSPFSLTLWWVGRSQSRKSVSNMISWVVDILDVDEITAQVGSS